jgi:hypothetical protein
VSVSLPASAYGRLTRNDCERRHQDLKTERSSWISQYREISTYLLPRNGRYILQDRNRGDRRHNAIFDSTGSGALDTLAAGLMSGMTSPARPWLRFITTDRNLMKSHAVKVWLKECADVVLLIFAKGNTYRALHQIYTEEGAFGTGATLCLDDFKSVMWHYPLTVGEYTIAQNWRGEVDTLYRELEKPVGSVVREFGLENCSDTVKSLYNRGVLDSWVPIVHVIEPRADRDPTKRDPKNMAWASCYFEAGTNRDNKFLRESGYNEFPAFVPRWNVIGGDIYGNGPGMKVLGDIKGLQQQQLRKAHGIDQLTRPAVVLPASMKNSEVDTLPGGVSYMEGQAQAHNLYDVRIDLNHLTMSIQDVRQLIREGFYADLFLMIANADPKMTATEVAARQEEKMMMLGPVVERNADELLNPLVRTTFHRAMAAGLLPPPPPEMHGQAFDVEYISVLAQAQRAISTNSIDRLVAQMFTVVAPVKPEVLDRFDPDQWAEIYSDALGVDPNLIVPAQAAALVRKQRAQAQAEAQQAQVNNLRADTAQKLATAPTAGGGSTVLQDLTNQFSGYGSPSPLEAAQ